MKKHMHADAEKDNPSGSGIDERSLFHGTDTLDICRGICINNFDFRKSGKNATAYGEGSYFARDASYSHHYTKASKSDERYMFRAKVLVGKFTQGRSDYRRPPEIPGESHKLYDACVDSPIDPSIFVVFDRSQTYPEYLIKYTVKTENVMTPSYGVSSPSTTSFMPASSSNHGLSTGSPSSINSVNSSRNTSATNFVGGVAPSVPTQKPASSSGYSSGLPSSTHSLNSIRNTSATNFVGGVTPSVPTQKPASSSSYSSGSPSSTHSLNSIRNTKPSTFVGVAAPSVTTQKTVSSSSYNSGWNSGSRDFQQTTRSASEYPPPSNPTPKKSSSDCAIL
jgi:poly [ADP-ribose] polymerase 7/11/12/13